MDLEAIKDGFVRTTDKQETLMKSIRRVLSMLWRRIVEQDRQTIILFGSMNFRMV